MKNFLVIGSLCALMVFSCFNPSRAEAGVDWCSDSILGEWSGKVKIVTSEGFSTEKMTLLVTAREGCLFQGQMTVADDEVVTPAQNGDSHSFNVTGVVELGKIRMTGSYSVFEGFLVKFPRKCMKIHGTGSRFESTVVENSATEESVATVTPAATFIYNLVKQEEPPK